MAKKSNRPNLSRPKPNEHVLYLQESLARLGYFSNATPNEGLFCDTTEQEVRLFQSQHIDKDGAQLVIDGKVGAKTWWAIENPAGDVQRNHFEPFAPEGITEKRQRLLDILLEEHAKDVREIPNGSNRSPEIDKYWGRTGVLGKPWCCAFVSWSLKECLGRLPIGGKHHLGVMNMWRNARTLGLGVEEAKPGDIFIQDMGGGQGHTGFVIGVSKNSKSIYTCEGNSGNRLKVGKRPISTIHHFIDALQDGQGMNFVRNDFDVSTLIGGNTR